MCAGVVSLANRFDDVIGQTFHLCADNATPLTAFPETLMTFPGLNTPAWVDPTDFRFEGLSPIEQRFFKRGAAVYADYFQRAPEFDDSSYRDFSGQPSPAADKRWWSALVAYALEAGFIKVRGGESP
ncbi:MAG: hypothetical protein AAFU56_08990 [Pseudomonadota bacterium]